MTDPSPPIASAAPIAIGSTIPDDLAEIAALHARAFGPGRFARTAYRVREQAGRLLISAHCRAARDCDGHLAGAVTMTAITVGGAGQHWLLGPLAVRPELAGKGLGRRLVAEALASVTALGNPAAVVVLVGDIRYYGPLGFAPVRPGAITFPGPVDPARILVWLGRDGTRACPEGLLRAVRAPENGPEN